MSNPRAAACGSTPGAAVDLVHDEVADGLGRVDNMLLCIGVFVLSILDTMTNMMPMHRVRSDRQEMHENASTAEPRNPGVYWHSEAATRPAKEGTITEHARPTDPPESAPSSRSRRTLLKAGWVAPMVVVLSLPAVSFDANASGRVGRIQPPPIGSPRVTPPPLPPWFWPPFLPWPPFRR